MATSVLTALRWRTLEPRLNEIHLTDHPPVNDIVVFRGRVLAIWEITSL